MMNTPDASSTPHDPQPGASPTRTDRLPDAPPSYTPPSYTPPSYTPPQIEPLGTLPQSTGMPVSAFELGSEPTR